MNSFHNIMFMGIIYVALGGASPAKPMTVDAFLTKADPLFANPALIMGSKDLDVLLIEFEKAKSSALALNSFRKARNLPPVSCPPNPVRIDAQDIIIYFRKYTISAQRKTTVATAVRSYLSRKHPCTVR